MQELVREYLNELGRKKRKRRRVSAIVAAFVIVVAGGVIWSLIQSGIAMTSEAKCGIEEHTHGEECYTDALVCGQEESEGHIHTEACYQAEQTLICGQEESEEHTHDDSCYQTENVLVCGQEEGEGHVHTDACHENQLTCGKEEHIHTDSCFIDSDADVEEASQWDAQYEGFQWKEAWGEDLAAAAANQIGYQESTKNYRIADDGSHKGYSRYGQFAGDAYADWDAAFVNFCIHYAGLEESQMFPGETETGKWYEKFVTVNEGNNKVYLSTPDGYEPETGDIIFLKKENEETETQMGIVSSYDKEKNQIKVIEGNSGNEVRENEYALDDSHISEYLMVTEMEKAYKGIPDDSGENAGDAEPADGAEKKADGTETTDKANEVDGETELADESVNETEDTKEKQEEAENKNWAYEESYDAGQVVIHVKAEEGVVPEGAELSVTPIEKKEVTDDMSRKEAKEAEEINAQYELTEKKLQEESEKKEESLQGFLAYDICFVVDGEEVEPSGDVKVTMDFKEAVKPEGVSENATVVVNHLKEDVDAEDGVVVEDLTEKEDTTIATSEADASVEKVELIADSFSTFTISWTYNTMGIAVFINVEAIDENKQIINSNMDSQMKIENGEEIVLGEYFAIVESTDGKFYKTKSIGLVDNNGTHEVVKAKADGLYFYLFNAQGERYSYVMGSTITIQLQCEETSALKITDNVREDGSIKAEGGEGIKTENPAAKYVWLKSINGGEFKEVQSVRYGEQTTISEDGTVLNVALDDGGLTREQRTVQYQVILRKTKEDGTVEVLAESEVYSVPYYGEIQNGSFEDPIITNEKGYQQVGMRDVRGWSTTDTQGGEGGKGAECIEIVRPSAEGTVDPYYGETYLIYADEGLQYAEINTEGNGALYQDVLTKAGIPLEYSFSHRGRQNSNYNGNDQLYVVIVPTKLAENGLRGDGNPIDTNKEVEELMSQDAAFKEANNVYIQDYTARVGEWQRHKDSYIPQTGMTRFFFVAAQEGVRTQGNYVDNISFGQNLPEPTKDTFNLRVEKTIIGLGSAAKEETALKKVIDNLQFEITVKDSNNTSVKVDGSSLLTGDTVILNANQLTWYKDKDDSYTGYYDYLNNLIGDGTYTVSVIEKNQKIDGYTVTDTSETTLSGDGTDENDSEEIKSKQSNSAAVARKQSLTVAYTNRYVQEDVKTKKISFTKVWEDFNNAYDTRPERLSVSLAGRITDSNGTVRDLTKEELEELFKDSIGTGKPYENLNALLNKTVTQAGNWGCEWDNVPVYYKNSFITWEVKETLEGNLYKPQESEETEETGALGTAVTDSDREKDEAYTITNALDNDEMRDWKMVKYSSSDTTKDTRLAGAEFEIREGGLLTSKVIATGISEDSGDIVWTLSESVKNESDNQTEPTWESYKKQLNGEYTIVETKAPEGYSLSKTDWKIEFLNGIPNISGTQPNIEEDKTDGIVFYIGNTALYSLPESGGSGIYWYMFGGILLMAGAALITYKKRCREVLKG